MLMQRVLWTAAALLLAIPSATAIPVDLAALEGQDADANREIQTLLDGLNGNQEGDKTAPAPPPEKDDPGFADRVATAFRDEALMWGAGSAVLVALGIGGLAMVTRYISPKEALRNPQRSMLYGYIRGNPGIHLKQLSEEFGMKTSSILWHMRKLESAELVSSDRVGGYRVFYAVEGGIEIRRVSRAITAIQNENARRIFQRVQSRPGSTTRQVSEALNIHGGTVRWHLRRLREHGLVDELVQENVSRFYNAPLGDRALETLEGAPVSTTRTSNQVPDSV